MRRLTYLDELLAKRIAVEDADIEPLAGRLRFVGGTGVNITGAYNEATQSTDVTFTASNAAALVTSVHTRTGDVVASAGDYNSTQITHGSGSVSTALATKADQTITISAGTGLAGGGDLSTNQTLRIDTAGASVGQFVSYLGAETVGWATVPSDSTKADKPSAGAYKLATVNAANNDFAYSSATLDGTDLNLGSVNLKTTGFISVGATLPSVGSIRVESGAYVGEYKGLYTIDPNGGADIMLARACNSGSTTWCEYGATASGRNTWIYSGGSNNYVTLAPGGTSRLQVSGSSVRWLLTDVGFASNQVNPTLQQDYESANTATGDQLTVHAQDCIGTTAVTAGALFLRGGDATGASGTRNGGNLVARAGAGATANGYLELQSGVGASGNRLRVDDSGARFTSSAGQVIELAPIGYANKTTLRRSVQLKTTSGGTTATYDVAVPSGYKVRCYGEISASDDAAPDTNYFDGYTRVRARNNGGTLTTPVTYGGANAEAGTFVSGAVLATLTASGGNLRITVDQGATGAANVTWDITLRVECFPAS